MSYGFEDQYPSPIATRDVTTLGYRIRGLQPETRYFVEVRAENDIGLSEPATSVAKTTPGNVIPAPPIEFSARPGNDWAELTWLKSSHAAAYRVSYGLHPDGAIIDSPSTSSEHFTVRGLQSSTAYYFDLVAYNAAGDSPPVRTTTTTLTVPAPPADLRAIPAVLSMDLSWLPSVGTIDYVILYGVEPGGSAESASTTLTSFKLEGLSKNTLYYIDVYAWNNNGPSLPARITQKTNDGPSIPGRPGVITTVVSSEGVDVGWLASTQPYEVTYGLVDKYPQVIQRQETEHQRIRFQYLAFDSRYFLEVRAFNASGYSEPRYAEFSTGPDRTHPRNLRNPGRSLSEAWLKWDPPIDLTFLIDYEITCPGLASIRTHELECVFTGLEPERGYLFTVQPRRREGPVPASSASISLMTHDRTPPTRPRALKLTPSTPGNATLTWIASDDVLGVAGYEVRRSGKDWVSVQGLSYAITDWVDAPQTFEIRAKDAAGNRSLISIITFKPELESCAPRNLQEVANGNRAVTISWDAPLSCSPIGYRVTLFGKPVDIGRPSHTFYNMIIGLPVKIAVSSRLADGSVSESVYITVLPTL